MSSQSSSFTIYPAIDLKEGQCVRLKRGDMSQATIYSHDPAQQAQTFQKAGFHWVHVVDLNGAFSGHSVNEMAVQSILKHVSIPIQLGGGLRDMETIEYWLDQGVKRVILGSVAVKNPQLVRDAAQKYPGRIVAGIDARNGRVATQGWSHTTDMTATDLALKMQDCGVAAIIFTEINRDGMLGGVDVEQTSHLAQKLSIPVIASGGVGSIKDVKKLMEEARHVPMLEGVIIGRALYTGDITPHEISKLYT